MTNTHYEFQIADHQFAEIVREVRAQGGHVSHNIITIADLKAGYSYRPGALKLNFEDKATKIHKGLEEAPLIDIINSAKVKGAAGAWPPAPEDPAKVEEPAPVTVSEPVAVSEATETAEIEPPAPPVDEHKAEVAAILAEG